MSIVQTIREYSEYDGNNKFGSRFEERETEHEDLYFCTHNIVRSDLE